MSDNSNSGEALNKGIKQKPNGVLSLLRSIFSKSDDGIKESLEYLLEKHDDRETPLDDYERRLISNILGVGTSTVKDIMIPRSEINAIDVNMSFKKAVEHMVIKPHSRYPVFNDNLDNVVGMVHIKDVLPALVKGIKPDLNEIMRSIIFVVPSMRMLDLLLQMRLERLHIAVVVDEFGGVEGLVTIEDVVEEIVGEIEDEHDVDEILFSRNDFGGVDVNARLLLDDLEDEIGKILSEEERNEDIDTIGGLIMHIVGRVPNCGEIIKHEFSGLEFIIVNSDPRRIESLQIRKLPTITNP